MEEKSISTFVINLKKRTERKKNIQKEFRSRKEFSLTIVEAEENKNGAIGLWNTIKHILQDLVPAQNEYIIICEDDHQFTEHYSPEYLEAAIAAAIEKKADILLGGVSWFENFIQVSEKLFWTSNFSGLQFTVIFRNLFPAILNSPLEYFMAADYQLASLTDNVMFLYPFISIQKDYGYSDATPKNNSKGIVANLFVSTANRLKILKDVNETFGVKNTSQATIPPLENITIPTYVINLPERVERLQHIKSQFAEKPEFDVTIVEACKHEIGAYGLWQSILKIINMAVDNDDDVIIICEDDHQFTSDYSKEYLLKNIIEAHYQGASYLSGGTGRFGYAIPLTENRYWVNHCLSAQFVVLYKKLFPVILSEPYDETVVADLVYSDITSNKMVLYPFISIQKDFGYSDVTEIHNTSKGIVNRLFAESERKLDTIQKAFKKYSSTGDIAV
ncbi:glycosyltransferase family 25 protein [Chitinophaga arvensicola]|uniref:Glycosyltransferase involved in LPS biosynthesis, GR25 family n=1 Tax=Chitinophaga arvensicola TaxID=29529 RepID=A0A1I0S8E2_9BACT|nr:hypothetical protein [Chitinophaga arvensicola]SEW52327.1 Glycosyltransferase involved in LPS biosynthesis, GR25 family [Chitinophaga arvensicola]